MPSAQLRDRTIIAVSGAETFGFLQNIMTADMDDVDRQGLGYGALLTPQGKIVCDFMIFKADSGYHLDVRADAAEALVKRLTLYRLRAKLEITPASDLAVFAGWGDDKTFPPTALPDPRLAALGHRWTAPAPVSGPEPDEAAWQGHRIALGVPEGGVDFLFDEAFPHDAAMDSLHGVAFDKGCYVGQEVVSRMRHRGTARRRIVKVIGGAVLPETGTEILAGSQPLGRLGSTSGRTGIALLRLDRVEKAQAAGDRILASDVPLDIELPEWAGYGWPSEAAAS